MAHRDDNLLVDSGISKKSELPRFRQGEIGSLGLKFQAGEIYEEYRRDLRFPDSIKTYKNMSLDPIVDSALKVITAFIRTVEFKVDTPTDTPTAQQQERADFIQSCMDDMDRPFNEYMQEWLSVLVYGFCPAEKVYKVRRGDDGNMFNSKFDDKLVGWAKLPVRSQDTIDKWIYDPKIRELIGIRQNLSQLNTTSMIGRFETKESKFKILPRSKFMLFRTDTTRDNPEGNSPLKGAYIAWKYKTSLEETEAIGASRDLRGLPIIYIPAEFMSPDATPDQVEFYEMLQSYVQNLQFNEQAGIIMPQIYNDQGKPMFEFQLTNMQGGRQNNTDEIIKRYENKILNAFMADVLKTGHDGSGSFALADSKTNLLAVGIESRLIEILDVVNNDLIPQTFKQNGWKEKDFPKISYGDLDEISLDEIGKFVQRVGAVGLMEGDKPLSDIFRKRVGAKPADKSQKLDDDLITGGDSKAGEGMKEGGSNGTGKVKKNNSATNSNNAA